MTATLTTLPNGVRVICDPMPGLETLALTVVAGRGAAHEDVARSGWSHLLEHMVFKGAGSRTSRDIVEVIESQGGSINAATGYERTSFQVRALKGGLNLGMEVIADLLLRPTLDDADLASRRQAERTMGYRSTTPNIDGSAGRRGRREGLFVSHKLSNDEQSTDPIAVKRRVKEAISRLGVGYLDMAMIHSPLTDAGRRIGTYRALLELRDAGFVRSVGVCNYGIGPLEEVRDLVGSGNVDDLPALNQLELSPFNAHIDVVRYCDSHGISIGCSAWSKLSGVDGPGEGWAVLSDLAKSKGMTKAQLLVRWSLQKGCVCVPRSGSSSKVERVAIAENSYGGVNPAATAKDESDNSDATSSRSFVLTDGEMKLLDGLDVGYKAGKLGRRDGWEDGDVVGPDWDPTDIV